MVAILLRSIPACVSIRSSSSMWSSRVSKTLSHCTVVNTFRSLYHKPEEILSLFLVVHQTHKLQLGELKIEISHFGDLTGTEKKDLVHLIVFHLA